MKNSGIVFVATWVVLQTLFLFISWIGFELGPREAWLKSSAFSVFLAAGTAAWYGIDIVFHYVLRLILYIRQCTPWYYSRFLDYGVSLIFLQKVGGGYIFIHRLVMEHFAKLESDPSMTRPASSDA